MIYFGIILLLGMVFGVYYRHAQKIIARHRLDQNDLIQQHDQQIKHLKACLRQSQEQIAEKQKRIEGMDLFFSDLPNLIKDLILIYGQDGRIRYANMAVVNVLGYQITELSAMSLDDINFVAMSQADQHINHIPFEKQTKSEIMLTTKTGSNIRAKGDAKPVIYDQRPAILWVAQLLPPVSQEPLTVEEAINVDHDIGNALNLIINFSEILSRTIIDAKNKSILVDIKNAGISLVNLLGKPSGPTLAPKMTLPDSLALSKEDNASETYLFNQEHVLIVDDVATNRDLLFEILITLGLTLHTAQNGEEAVKLAQKIQPDVIIMDIRMPVMDGYQAGNIIKTSAQTASIPIIALSGSKLEDNGDIKDRDCFAAILTKPFQIEKLKREIQRALARSNAPEQALATSKIEVFSHNLKNPKALLERFAKEVCPYLEENNGAVKLKSIRKLAEILLNMGHDYQEDILKKQGEALKKAAEQFDLLSIRASLEEIKTIAAFISS